MSDPRDTPIDEPTPERPEPDPTPEPEEADATTAQEPQPLDEDEPVTSEALPEEPAEAWDPNAPVIRCDTLSRWYGTVMGVNNLTVDIEPGVTGLLGPNGAGKSTFMQLAMGLIRPSSGTLEVLGQNPRNNTKLMRRLGYVGEGDAPWRELSGRDAALLAARLSGLGHEEAEAAVARALDTVGLTDVQDRPVDGYSRGMRQRLKFALALLHEPDLYILDEPLLGTDPETRAKLIDLIRDLERQGKSILVSTHVLPDVEAMTNRIMLLNNGRLMAYGEVDEIRNVLEQYPRTVRIETPDPRGLGSQIWGWDTVMSIEVEPAALRVRTQDVKAFYAQLQAFLSQNRAVEFTSITSPDESLEAIFQYLVE